MNDVAQQFFFDAMKSEAFMQGYAVAYAQERGATGEIPHWTKVLIEGYSRDHAVHMNPWADCGRGCLDCGIEKEEQ